MNNDLYYQMLRIRMIEERIAKRYPEGKMRCPVHLSVGQEAAAVGVCAALGPEDKMVSTHRGHAHYLAKGGSLNGLIGELYGKQSGCSRGNGGSMHLIDLGCNFYGSTSIVGGTIPVGVGLAFADHLRGSKATTVICIGDAAIEEGVFHEAANFASLHRLNVLFVCENNKYSCYTDIVYRQPRRTLSAVAGAHRLEYAQADDQHDVKYVVESLVAEKRLPAFLEIPTWRQLEHCGPNNDDHLGYRDQSMVNYWKEKDPLKNRARSSSEELLIEQEINNAFEHAEKAPYPGEEEIGAYVYANT